MGNQTSEEHLVTNVKPSQRETLGRPPRPPPPHVRRTSKKEDPTHIPWIPPALPPFDLLGPIPPFRPIPPQE
uniref:Uncharacterized protein n=1 Tax=Acrobeloides nanus TaxID=290746 RepID=A0A914DB06_9BILA